MKGVPGWIKDNTVLGYVLNCYEGVEDDPNRRGMMRRVWLWEEDAEVRMGNTEAFTLHLGRKFGLDLKPAHASGVHALLRELGETITPHRSHAAPDPNSTRRGRFRQPDPEEWVVRRKGKE